VKSLRALGMVRGPAVLIYMINPTPAMAAASTTPAWTTGPNEIQAVISWARLEEQVAAYRAEVDDAALGTPAAEVLDIEDDAEVIFRAVHQHDTETSGGYILSPCSIVNEGVVANTCCSFEVFTKLTIYPSLDCQLIVHYMIPPTYPALIRGSRILTNVAVAFAIHQLELQRTRQLTYWNQQ
jgi:hypothetical protein